MERDKQFLEHPRCCLAASRGSYTDLETVAVLDLMNDQKFRHCETEAAIVTTTILKSWTQMSTKLTTRKTMRQHPLALN